MNRQMPELLLVLTVGLILTMAGGIAAAKTTVTVWSEWSWALETFYKVVEVFEEKNPDIDVDWQYQSDRTDKLIAAVIGDVSPDVVTTGVSVDMVEKGLFAPLTDYLKNSELYDAIPASLWPSRTVNGEIYGVPALEGGPNAGLYFNRDRFAEAGLQPLQTDEVITMDELVVLSRKLVTTDADGNPVKLGFYPYEISARSLNRVCRFFETNWWDADEGVAKLDRPELIDALETMAEFFQPFGYAKMTQAMSNYFMWPAAENSAFANGMTALMECGYWGIGNLRDTMPDGNYGVTWSPNVNRRRVQNLGGWSVVIPSASKHKDEAFRFIEFLASAEAQAIIFEDLGWFGGIPKGLLEQVEIQDPNLEWFLRSTAEADVLLGPDEPNPYGSKASQLWNESFQKVVTGESSARQALEDANRLLNAEVEQNQ